MSRARGAALPFALGVLAACAPAQESRSSAVELTPCHVVGLDEESRCGTIEVWEDRAARQGRRIALRILVVPALRPVPEPDPVFFLAGGPGQSAIDVAPLVYPLLDDIRATRDLVFVDQRGTGGSNPLRCGDHDRPLPELLRDGFDLEELRACREGYDADLTKYVTTVAMDDLDEVRSALGYERVNLVGGSYGTRAALAYLRQHGEHVRTAVIDGVAPPSLELFLHFASDGQAAWDKLAADCAASPACAAAFPTPTEDLAALTRDGFHGRAEDPRSGRIAEVTISGTAVGSLVRTALYSTTTSALLPLALSEARQGNPTPLVSLGMAAGGAGLPPTREPEPGIALGMMLSVVCAEDVVRFGEEDIRARAAGSFLGAQLALDVRQACEQWPRAEVEPAFWEVVRSDVPVLVLSGGLDPVTPPRTAELALPGLSAALHGVAPHVGHGVMTEGCTPRRISRFIERGSTAGLDMSCLARIPRPPFFVDTAGAP